MRLNVGSGMFAREEPEYINVDLRPAPDVDVIADVEHLPFRNSAFQGIYMSHVIEHLPDHMAAMEELWRVAQPDAVATVRCPYGSTDLAYDDPDHVRQLHVGFWKYLAQPTYWRNSFLYRYAADWKVVEVKLFIRSPFGKGDPDRVMERVNTLRNVVEEMVAILRAVKPARPRDEALLDPTPVSLVT